MEGLLEVGQIVNTYGIQGFFKVKPLVDNKEQFQNFSMVYITIAGTLQNFTIEQIKFAKDMVLLKCKGVETIEQAKNFRDCYVLAKRDEISLTTGSYFIVDLIGLEVYTEQGEFLGILKEVLQPGANDVYVIETKKKQEILLPAIPDVIQDINVADKKMIVKLLKGLI